MTNTPIDAMLKDFGIANNDQRQTARAALAEAGVISRPHRASIAASISRRRPCARRFYDQHPH